MRGCDAVVHCAAALPSYAPDEIMSTEVKGTGNVLRAAREVGISRVVHISSTAVYGTKASGATEDSEIEIIGPYAEAKVLAENECVMYRAQGMCIPVLAAENIRRAGAARRLVDPVRLGAFRLRVSADRAGHQPISTARRRRPLRRHPRGAWWGRRRTVNTVFNVGAKHFGTHAGRFPGRARPCRSRQEGASAAGRADHSRA